MVTLDQAQRAITAGVKAAQGMGVKVSICVVDARGDLLAAARMDGARYFTLDVARGKAMVSATFAQPSANYAERAGSPVMQSLNQLNGGRFFFAQGAVPVAHGGNHDGAIGVSGATAQQDEEIAKAAAAALG
jgi:uncharacterized protein GlcG (DUF336 family)